MVKHHRANLIKRLRDIPGLKRIAAIVTTWFEGSHADLIVSKFAAGFPTVDGLIEPRVDLVSLYMDQIHHSDIGLAFAKRHGITVYPSIRSALTLTPPSAVGHWPTAADWDDGELAVDGVLIVGEHGDYPINDRGQRQYPRRHFLEQVCGVFSASDRYVPVFSDKHLSHSWDDALWMYRRAQEFGFPIMAGSSLPVSARVPFFDHELGAEIQEALAVGYHHSYPGGLESYGFHTLELLQSMVERRSGFEAGVASVQCLEGREVWQAAETGLWSRDLAAAAESRIKSKNAGRMEDNCVDPKLFLVHYRDGLRAAALLLPGHLGGFGYAARVGDRVASTGLNSVADSQEPFSYLGLNIQQMFLTDRAQYPVERTLLVTGMLEALVESRHMGHVRVETPHLGVSYVPAAHRPMSTNSPS